MYNKTHRNELSEILLFYKMLLESSSTKKTTKRRQVMNAIVTNFGDFDIAISFDEFNNWSKDLPIEGELLQEGEIPCGKKIKIILELNAKKIIDYRLDSDNWNHASTIKLVCNQVVYDRLDKDGKINTELNSPAIRIFIQLSNAFQSY